MSPGGPSRSSFFPSNRVPFRVAFVYWVLGSAWILISDALTDGASVQTIKGLAFVLASAMLVYLLVRKGTKELQETRRMSSTLLSNLPGMAYRCRLDEHWTMEYVSEGCEELTGYAPEGLVANRDLAYEDLIHPEDREQVRMGIEEALECGEPFRIEYRLLTRAGEEKWVWEQGRAVEVPGSKETMLEGLIIDVSREHDLERQVSRAQRLESVGQLAGGVAHDFNNILTAISGYADLLSMKIRDDDRLLQDVMGIQKAAQRASNLTRQLLAFSRQQIIEPKVIDINELITDLNKMLYRLIGEDIQLETNLAEEIGRIKADPGQIEQILINLIVNAADAIKPIRHLASEKKITIDTQNVIVDKLYTAQHPESKEGNYVLLTVGDNGTGIKKEIMDKIFDPFFTTKPKGEGTGLGLATVYGIVKQNGGFINLYSEPDTGTIFRIYWPVCSDSTLHQYERNKATTIMRGTETILFVEDDQGVRDFGMGAMESLGYKVIMASNGLEALEIIKSKSKKIDLVISDVIMPQMGGKELSDKITKINPDISVLFSSGYTNSQIEQSGILEKGINFILKPYSVSELSQKIREVLDS